MNRQDAKSAKNSNSRNGNSEQLCFSYLFSQLELRAFKPLLLVFLAPTVSVPMLASWRFKSLLFAVVAFMEYSLDRHYLCWTH
jgi:hypothetical protein